MFSKCQISQKINSPATYIERINKIPMKNHRDSNSQSFQPEYHQIKKLGMKVNKSKITVGEWKYYENQLYLQFIVDNFQDFTTEQLRRRTKVFYRLSKILKKRTPDQCRSHHQKLQLKYNNNLYAIIAEIQKKIQKSIAHLYVDYQFDLHLKNVLNMQNPDHLQKTVDVPQNINEMKKGQQLNIKSNNSNIRIEIQEKMIEHW